MSRNQNSDIYILGVRPEIEIPSWEVIVTIAAAVMLKKCNFSEKMFLYPAIGIKIPRFTVEDWESVFESEVSSKCVRSLIWTQKNQVLDIGSPLTGIGTGF